MKELSEARGLQKGVHYWHSADIGTVDINNNEQMLLMGKKHLHVPTSLCGHYVNNLHNDYYISRHHQVDMASSFGCLQGSINT